MCVYEADSIPDGGWKGEVEEVTGILEFSMFTGLKNTQYGKVRNN
jgi:hypothetical protein